MGYFTPHPNPNPYWKATELIRCWAVMKSLKASSQYTYSHEGQLNLDKKQTVKLYPLCEIYMRKMSIKNHNAFVTILH